MKALQKLKNNSKKLDKQIENHIKKSKKHL